MNAVFSERYLSGLVAAERLTVEEVLGKLDYTKYLIYWNYHYRRTVTA